MSKFLILLFVTILPCCVIAQEKKFDPEKFRAEQEQFIVKEACLSPQEAAKFFPIFREMQKKERAVFDKQRKLGKIKPATEEGCLNAIKTRDDYDIELKMIQQKYHFKFLEILPASKVYDVIHAVDKFHRREFKKVMKQRQQTLAKDKSE